jgi:hypothetical protein
LLDGSEWLFIGATPTAGSAPADGNPNWERKSDALVPVDSTGAALEAIVAEAKETADRKSATFFQDTAPSAADSDVNDIWVNTADGNRSYRRVPGSGRLSIGSDAITLGGDHIILAWTFCDDQRIGQAILDAAGALGVADGKASRFTMFRSNEPEPVGDGIGDLLTRAYLSPPQIDHWNGSDWIPASTYGATAQQSADIAAVVSDGVLSKGEKPAVVLEYNRVNSEYTAQAAQAIALGVGASERTIAATKLSALNSYMAGLSPAYTDTSADTVIVAATYQAKWNDVYVANANLAAIVSGTIGAPSGTPVGTITADDVSGTIKSGGGVGTNQVDTPALQPNSATLLAFAVDASAHTLAAGATDDGLPLSYTSIGASVRVDFRVQVGRSAGSATTGNTIFVRRTGAGDTTLKAMGIPFSSASGGETDYWTVDTPPAGAVTYLMKFSRDSGSGSVLYSDQQITILEAKR